MPPKTKSSRANVYNRGCPSQSILALIGSKWSILVLMFAARRAAPRTHQLKHRLEGVSSKMLTQTLRELERHGIVRRRDFGGSAATGRIRPDWRSDGRSPGSP